MNYKYYRKITILMILTFFISSRFIAKGSFTLSQNDEGREKKDLWFFDAINFDPNSDIFPRINTLIKIAIIDSGFNGSLESLKNNTWRNENEIEGNGLDDDKNGYIDDYNGFDFVLNDSIQPYAGSYTTHATFIAHQLGGIKLNNDTIAGLIPNVSLVNIRVLDDKNRIDELSWERMVNALRYAILIKADIIILSTEFLQDPPESVKAAFSEIHEAKIPLVTITGNSRGEIISYPALLDWTITVGAIERINNNFTHAKYSNIGKNVDIVAPGTNIPSYDRSGILINMTGTSFAAPFVTGTLAWMKIIDNSLSNEQIKAILMNSAINTGDCYSNGAGILNFTKTLLVTKGKLSLPENHEANRSLCKLNHDRSSQIPWNISIYQIILVFFITVFVKKIRK